MHRNRSPQRHQAPGRLWPVALGLTALALTLAPRSSQGQSPGYTLTPGPIGSTEVRTPISALPVVIDQSGSYYVTDCLTGVVNLDGILVEAENVTIDLNGYTLVGPPGSLSAIRSDRDGLTVFGGDLTGWQSGGVYCTGADTRIEGLRAIDSGIYGLRGGPGSIVRDCYVSGSSVGVLAGAGSTIQRCLTSDCSEMGIGGQDNGGSTLDCVAADSPKGFQDPKFGSKWLIRGCVASGNDLGYRSHGQTLLEWNIASGGDVGLNIGPEGRNLIQDNLMYGNDVGIRGPGVDAVITRNVCSLNTINYDQVDAASDWGLIVGSTGLNGAWVNLSH